ncbi:MAG TPA: hypothetical protein VK203_22390 [Nostocaceae cyanobacterium]|nr:hypothetical protein [Nostocaceae cyanobacterium]
MLSVLTNSDRLHWELCFHFQKTAIAYTGSCAITLLGKKGAITAEIK